MEYKEEDYLQLSGIQHFEFCRRQWALIYIENIWVENELTAEGRLIHKNAHDIDFIEKRKDTIITRGMRVFSSTLGVSGECDVVEFHRDDLNGINLSKWDGKWILYPVEYKHGKEKHGDEDVLQLVCQAMCLEEMLCVNINKGYLYYYEVRHRTEVIVTDELRDKVKNVLDEMHQYVKKQWTPKVKTSAKCKSCSVKEICLPKLMKELDVKKYISKAFLE